MRFARVTLGLVALVLSTSIVCGCGDKVDDKRPAPAAVEEDAVEQPVAATAKPREPGLSGKERDQLAKKLAREALSEISLDNAEGEGWRMLQTIRAELAAERAAAGITDAGAI